MNTFQKFAIGFVVWVIPALMFSAIADLAMMDGALEGTSIMMAVFWVCGVPAVVAHWIKPFPWGN